MKWYQKLITSSRFNYLRAYGEPATNDRSNLTILSEQHSIKHCSDLIVLSLNRPTSLSDNNNGKRKKRTINVNSEQINE